MDRLTVMNNSGEQLICMQLECDERSMQLVHVMFGLFYITNARNPYSSFNCSLKYQLNLDLTSILDSVFDFTKGSINTFQDIK